MAQGPSLKPIRAKPGQPLFLTVKDAVRDVIDAGVYSPGERLPSTKALSKQLDVSLVTVHRALQELVASGVIRRGQGRGTFVHEDYGSREELATGLRFGLVFHRESSLADSYHSQVLEGVRRGAEELGVDLVLLRFGEDWRNECQGYLYVNPFEDQLARPPRFVGRARSALGNTNVSGTVSAGGTPVMVVGARFDHPNVSVVDTDNAALARDAVMHLAELGHRRIALVGGGAGSHQMSNTLDRSRGFAEGVRDSGLSVDPRHIIAATSWRLEDQGRQQLAAMLAMPPAQRPTAVFAAGYYFALDVYEAAATAGLRIPDDLSVVGVDDPPSAPHLSPPLTTMRQPLGQMGRLAARGLFDQVGESRPTVQTTLLKAELVVRRSTGPATTA